MKDRNAFEVVAFDSISAVEAAIDQRKAMKAGNQKLDLEGSRQCIKADRQIVAVGKTRKVDAIYAADGDIIKIGDSMSVTIIALWDLPLPPEALSNTPLFDASEEEPKDAPS
jgi:hypothetical protein